MEYSSQKPYKTKTILTFDISKKGMLIFLTDFFFIKALHETISVVINDRWIIQKDSGKYRCIELINKRNLTIRIDYANHPQFLFRKLVRNQIESTYINVQIHRS
jgi:hypothetical protein